MAWLTEGCEFAGVLSMRRAWRFTVSLFRLARYAPRYFFFLRAIFRFACARSEAATGLTVFDARLLLNSLLAFDASRGDVVII